MKTKKNSRLRRAYLIFAVMLLVCTLLSTYALAEGETADDPLTIVNNLSDFVFSALRAIGVIVLGWALCRWACRYSRTTRASARKGFSAYSADC